MPSSEGENAGAADDAGAGVGIEVLGSGLDSAPTLTSPREQPVALQPRVQRFPAGRR
jgi:hypothetical protein